MDGLISLILLFLCCHLSSQALTEREIRDNFQDVQTGMGVLLRELIIVMEKNDEISRNLNNSNMQFEELIDINRKVDHTIKKLKKALNTSKDDIIQTQRYMFKNFSEEKMKMKKELSKFISNKYAFLAWMIYKLEAQNNDQEKSIAELKSENVQQKLKTKELEEEIVIMKKKLENCKASVTKNNEIITNTSQVVGEIKNSMSSLMKTLAEKIYNDERIVKSNRKYHEEPASTTTKRISQKIDLTAKRRITSTISTLTVKTQTAPQSIPLHPSFKYADLDELPNIKVTSNKDNTFTHQKNEKSDDSTTSYELQQPSDIVDNSKLFDYSMPITNEKVDILNLKVAPKTPQESIDISKQNVVIKQSLHKGLMKILQLTRKKSK